MRELTAQEKEEFLLHWGKRGMKWRKKKKKQSLKEFMRSKKSDRDEMYTRGDLSGSQYYTPKYFDRKSGRQRANARQAAANKQLRSDLSINAQLSTSKKGSTTAEAALARKKYLTQRTASQRAAAMRTAKSRRDEDSYDANRGNSAGRYDRFGESEGKKYMKNIDTIKARKKAEDTETWKKGRAMDRAYAKARRNETVDKKMESSRPANKKKKANSFFSMLKGLFK